jgi:hypothetical protein
MSPRKVDRSRQICNHVSAATSSASDPTRLPRYRTRPGWTPRYRTRNACSSPASAPVNATLSGSVSGWVCATSTARADVG